MALTRSFRFVDDKLNQRLITLLKRNEIFHNVDKNGSIHYAPSDEELVENELICSIRDDLYPVWKIICCPGDWADSYKNYMVKHGVPFFEELIDNQLCYLIPRKYRPHAWKLVAPIQERRTRMAR